MASKDSKPEALPDSAKDRILEAAIALLRQAGLAGAGVNQILALSRTPKGSLYHYFPGGKEQIIQEALTLYATRVAKAFEHVLSGQQAPADKVRALFRFVADRFEDASFERSCAVGAVVLDLDAESAVLRAAAAAAFDAWRSVIARHLEAMGAAQSKALAGVMLSTIEGAYVRGRAERSGQAFIEAGEMLATLVRRLDGGTPAGR